MAQIRDQHRLRLYLGLKPRPQGAQFLRRCLDSPRLLYVGYGLPCRLVLWKRLESVAQATDPMMLRERQWCSAHGTLQVQTALIADGHELG
jgi:hypothetical protein